MAGYDLRREPWLPCIDLGGETRLLGLLDVLTGAHELRELAAGSPAETAALHRMLLAFAARVLEGPPDVAAWTRAWRAGRFDVRKVARYLDRWGNRLDLFATDRAFYQSGAVQPLAARGPEKAPVRRMIFELCDFGAASHLFAQRRPALTAIPVAQAARSVVAFQSFAQGGLTMGGSDAAAPLVLPGVVLATGANLFETLLLNTIPAPPVPHDRPAWEDERGPTSGLTRPALGRLDVLTWQSRSLGLHLADDGGVDGFAYVPGERMADAARDPMGAWRERKGIWYPVGIQPDRVVWRDAHALLQQSGASVVRPAVCDHLAAVAGELGESRTLSLAVLGMRWDQKRILIARHERFPVTPGLLRDETRIAAIGAALARVEEFDGHVRAAIWALSCQALGAADKKTITLAADGAGAQARFWAALRTPFERLLLESGGAFADAAAAAFAREASSAALRAVADASRARLGDSARSIRAAAVAERVLRARMARPPEETA